MSFINETAVKAVRKRHRCEGCHKHIEIGEPAQRWAGMSDGVFFTTIYHPDCREAEVRLNDIAGWSGDGDDWCVLDDADRDDWPWLIEEFPAVAVRLGISNAPADHPSRAAARLLSDLKQEGKTHPQPAEGSPGEADERRNA